MKQVYMEFLEVDEHEFDAAIKQVFVDMQLTKYEESAWIEMILAA